MPVPKKMIPYCETIIPILKNFCDTGLEEENEEYLTLCLKALEKLARMRPSPLLRGKPRTWAAGIAYFICAQNDRFSVSCPKRLKAAEVAGSFGLSISSASNQANTIRRMFGVLNYDERCHDFFHIIDDPWRLPTTDMMMKAKKPSPAPIVHDLPNDFSDILDRFRTD